MDARDQESMQALKDLAAMRLMHAMPLDEARKKFSELYEETTAETLQTMRRRAIARFQEMFDTDEEPRHAPIFNALGAR